MNSSLKVLDNSRSTCGTCNSTGCGTCGPVPSVSHAPTLLTRRDLGRTIVGASAAALLVGCSSKPATEQGAAPTASAPPAAAPALSPDLAVVQQSKGPVMTVLEEFYKMGPGPSSSHTMGPMRITYDFFQRVSKLPDDQLRRATALKVHLYGSLSATGKGHGTDRACLAGLLGKAPATCPPAFLDGLATNPDEDSLNGRVTSPPIKGNRNIRLRRRRS